MKDFEALTPNHFLIRRNFCKAITWVKQEHVTYVVDRDGGKCSCLLNTSGVTG